MLLSTFFLYSLHSILIYRHSLIFEYTVRPRSKLLFRPCLLFSFFQACSDSSPSRLPIVIPSNHPLSTHFLSSFLRSSLSRASFSKSISIGFLFRSLVHDRRSPQHPPHLPSSRSSTNLRLSFNSFSSLAFSFDFLQPLCLTPLSFSFPIPFFFCLRPFLSIPSLSVSFSYTRRRLGLSPSRTAFLRCGTNRQSRAAGGTEKRRP